MIRKHLSLIAGIAFALCSHSIHASVADPIRSIGASLSNYLAVLQTDENADKKVVAALKKGVTAANRASDVDLGANVKIAGQIATAVLRTSVSNEFGAAIDAVVDSYSLAIGSEGQSSSNLLRTAYPSGPRTAAERNLAQLFNYVATADNSADLIAAAKALSKAAVKAKVVNKLVNKALLVPPPPAHVTANVVIQGTPAVGAIAYKSRAAGFTQFSPGTFTLISGGTAGTELRTVSFALTGLAPGSNDIVIEDAAFTYASLKRNGVFVNGQGTAQVNWDPESKTLVGTFTYDMTEQGGTRTATITGSFSGTY